MKRIVLSILLLSVFSAMGKQRPRRAKAAKKNQFQLVIRNQNDVPMYVTLSEFGWLGGGWSEKQLGKVNAKSTIRKMLPKKTESGRTLYWDVKQLTADDITNNRALGSADIGMTVNQARKVITIPEAQASAQAQPAAQGDTFTLTIQNANNFTVYTTLSEYIWRDGKWIDTNYEVPANQSITIQLPKNNKSSRTLYYSSAPGTASDVAQSEDVGSAVEEDQKTITIPQMTQSQGTTTNTKQVTTTSTTVTQSGSSSGSISTSGGSPDVQLFQSGSSQDTFTLTVKNPTSSQLYITLSEYIFGSGWTEVTKNVRANSEITLSLPKKTNGSRTLYWNTQPPTDADIQNKNFRGSADIGNEVFENQMVITLK